MPPHKPQPTQVFDLLLGVAVAAVAVLLQAGMTTRLGPDAAWLVIQPAIVLVSAALGRPAALVVWAAGCGQALISAGSTAGAAGWSFDDLMLIALHSTFGAALVVIGGRLRLRSRSSARAEQRLTLAQDETGVGLFELDYRANTAYASPALCQILGQPVMDGPVSLQHWLAALNDGHVEDSRRTLEQKVADGELRYEREIRLQRTDGSEHWLLSRIRLDLDADGKLAAARGATLDITARKALVLAVEAAQAQLQQQLDDLNRLHGLSNRLLAMPVLDEALQAALEAVCAFHGTPTGLLQVFGETAASSRVAAHVGLADAVLAELQAGHAAPDGNSVCGLSALSRQRVIVGDLEEDGRFEALRPLGRSIGIRSVHSTPLVAGSGRVMGVLTVLMAAPWKTDDRLLRLTDLCAGQAAALIEREEALSMARQAQRRFEVALQSSSIAFTILAPVRDQAGRIVDFAWSYANPAAAVLIGRPAEQLVGQRVVDVLPNAWDEPGFFDRYVRVSEQGCPAGFETLTYRREGPRWLDVILSPLNGSVVVWFADITQRRQQQQALQDADRRKDEFLATLAHELRNPLAPIRHAAAIAREMTATESQRQWSLGVIERQLQHMSLLLDDLLDVSRVTRGNLTLRLTRSSLQTIVAAAVETARPLFAARDHRLTVDLPDDALWLEVDELRIGQVLGNILVNAAKYTEPGGDIRLTACRDGSDVLIAVSDNGSGLHPDDCERVFEMFTQLSPAPGGPQSGLGIGLALARSLVRLHGGQLDARSPGPGCGSTFLVRLPCLQAAREARDLDERNGAVARPEAGVTSGHETPAPAAPASRSRGNLTE